MQVRHFFFHIVFLLSFLLTAQGQTESVAYAGIITINYPPDKTVMEFGLLNISLKIPPGFADTVKVLVNDAEDMSLVPDREFLCFHVFLDVGVNKIKIIAMKKNVQVDSVDFTAFRRSDLESQFTKPLAGYKKDHFHARYYPQCAECHNLEPTESDKRPANIASFSLYGDKTTVSPDSTCYSCHKAITSYQYVHGPASVWSCLSCHRYRSNPVYSVKKPDTDVCFSCHTEQENDWGTKKYIHGPVNTGRCAICHSPHASGNPFNLFKPTWELCVSCHAEKASGKHVLVGYIYDGHPTHEVPDPLREGKELTCASCHNPHASNYPNLWALSVETEFELCQKCHKY
jgi:predicted CXXCH cytochrome family protein